MAREVNISTATTTVEQQANLASSQALSNLGVAIGDAARVTSGIAGQQRKEAERQKADQEILEKKSAAALSKFQFSSGNMKFSDQWSALNAKNSNSYNEEDVFLSIDTLFSEQEAAIAENTLNTDDANVALLDSLNVNKQNARNAFRANKANAMGKAAFAQFEQIHDAKVDQLDYEGIESNVNAAIADGLITPKAGEVIMDDSVDQVETIRFERHFFDIESGKFIAGDGTSIEAIQRSINDIDNSDLPGKNKKHLRAVGAASISKIASAQGQTIRQISIDLRKPENIPNAQILVDGIEDKQVQKTQQRLLDEATGDFEIAKTEAADKLMKEEAADLKDAVAASAEDIAKAQAQEAKIRLTRHTTTKFSQFDPSGEVTTGTYDMTPAAHQAKVKSAFFQLKSGLRVSDIKAKNQSYEGHTAYRYMLHEINAVADKEARNQMLGELNEILADPEMNQNLTSIKPEAQYMVDAFWGRGTSKQKNIYPAPLKDPIRAFDDAVTKALDDVGIARGDAGLLVDQAFNLGLEQMQAAYYADPKEFEKNKNEITKTAIRGVSFVTDQLKLKKSYGGKQSDNTTYTTDQEAAITRNMTKYGKSREVIISAMTNKGVL